MKAFDVDGATWRTDIDAIDGLLAALKPLGVHGSGIDAFIDSMIYGGMLEAEPPYQVNVRNLTAPEPRAFIQELSAALAEARDWRKVHYGDDVQVAIHLAD